ncbi:carbon-nitrogen hydrolase family protein [Limnohabitans sp. Hippo4]|jgi:aliphatic nitrilase|uniref:carbon-nitrogen hydrolase family protein n=1 Tax=Limnohabitans sp. Hippo4 TaxID=1826167 RepID=UPI000D3A0FB1|nr:carbon-nitrogen hydrolase family protein [Limnohabitans sp. Hippo4]MDE3227341.1 carbon-nitrogen hydrolase family protein [Acidobacteriota bacterium]PUE38083.1 aliphatic nitrilase [Limnohabitans sp. Hippo4]
MAKLSRFKVAAVQASPIFLDTAATIEKVINLIHEASMGGASLVVFPEVFVSAYPYWSWVANPIAASPWFQRLCESAIEVPGPEVARIAQAAKDCEIHVAIGLNERAINSQTTIYNTMLLIGPDGSLIGKHRKLVPTWAEKMSWAQGDGAGLRVHQTEIGPIGMLACGENTNTLARFALLAQGELVHLASYISLPVAPPDYDMAEAIKVRAMAHSFEGKVFTVVSCSTISPEIVASMEDAFPGSGALLSRKNSAFSGVIGPDGRLVGSPLIDQEGIVYADIDLSKCIQPRQMHDITGQYNRFDVFDLRVNRRSMQPATFHDDLNLDMPDLLTVTNKSLTENGGHS